MDEIVGAPENPVLHIDAYINDEEDNWFNLLMKMNSYGQLSIEGDSPPSSNSKGISTTSISHPNYYTWWMLWHPRCCGFQHVFCLTLKSLFYWRQNYIMCLYWSPRCFYYLDYDWYYNWYDPCRIYGKWGLFWLIYWWWFGYY
jgi:hypothetical protein